jgi:hypothetical protein
MIHPSPRGEIEARIERIGALIAGARRLIAESRDLDLSVLAFAVADLRDAVRAASPDATAGLAPRVTALRAALDALGDELEKAKPMACPEIRRAAIRAYDGSRRD